MKRESRAPLIFAIALFLLVLYVGSYFALVVPRSWLTMPPPGSGRMGFRCNYRIESEWVLPTLFWPLEQIDRKVRPDQWGNP